MEIFEDFQKNFYQFFMILIKIFEVRRQISIEIQVRQFSSKFLIKTEGKIVYGINISCKQHSTLTGRLGEDFRGVSTFISTKLRSYVSDCKMF